MPDPIPNDAPTPDAPQAEPSPQGERHARAKLPWLIAVVAVALLLFQAPDRLAASDEDADFVQTLLELKRQITRDYVTPVTEQELRRAAIAGMMYRLDPYSGYFPPVEAKELDDDIQGVYVGVGILLDPREEGLTVVAPIQGGPAQEAGVQSGDRILEVDGRDITDLPLPEARELILGEPETLVTLTLARGDEALELTMPRRYVKEPMFSGFKRLPDGSWQWFIAPDASAAGDSAGPVQIAYVRLERFTHGSAEELATLLEQLQQQGMDGLILDLRFNGGGELKAAETMLGLFLGDYVPLYGIRTQDGETFWPAGAEAPFGDLPLALLVNEASASASEVVAGALRDHGRATLVGMRTFGKGSVQRVYKLPDEASLKMTIAHWVLPSGRVVQRNPESDVWGVDPQIEVKVDFENAPTQDPAGPLFPQQVEVAYDALLAEIAARQQEGELAGEPIEPVSSTWQVPLSPTLSMTR